MTATRPSALNEEDRTLLLLSVAQYLQKNGFSKTVKKLRSEAQLEEDGWKGPKLDLEEMCLKFLDKGNNASIDSSGLDQDGKKKKSKEDSKNLVADHSGDADKSVHENDSIKEKKKAKRSSETLAKGRQELRPGETKEPGSDVVNELQHNEDDNKQKNKKKKDRQSVPEPLSDGENQQVEIMPEQATGGKSEDVMTSKEKDDASCEVKKSKDKMKKKSKSTSNEIANDVEEKQDKEKSKSMKKDANKAVSEGETITSEIEKENKPQKRKRLGSEDNDSQRTDKEPLEQLKRRTKEHKESIASEQKSDVKVSPNGEVDLLESQETPSKHQDGNENGNLIKTAEKSTTGKDMKRQRNGSAEPKSTTAKAFQRVKVGEVVFADEKLKDNSYWAKDGAEIGYGAKAQEVLGQVRGRDFRHEKTKKKRGSYRGGQIDLQSHSVKFNYSDDE